MKSERKRKHGENSDKRSGKMAIDMGKETEKISHGARKKILVTAVGCALILGVFAGIDRNLVKQETIELETVSDEVPAEENNAPFEVAAKGAVLIDADTGKVLFSQNHHEELPLASVTKVMTMLIVMESVDSGKISLDDEVTISERAASMGGSQMYMEAGETHTVSELLKGVAMASANDGCVAFNQGELLGEKISAIDII